MLMEGQDNLSGQYMLW